MPSAVALKNLSANDVAILVVGLTCAVVLIVQHARAACTQLLVVLAYIKRCRLLQGWRPKADDADEADEDKRFTQRILMKVEQQRARYTTFAVQLTALGTMISLPSMLWNIATGQYRWMSPVQDWCLLLWLGLGILAGIFPQLGHGRARDLMYSAIMMLFSIAIATTKERHVFMNAMIFSVRLLLSMAHGRTGTILFWSTLWMVASQFGLHMSFDACDGARRSRVPIQDLMYFATIVGCVHLANTSMWAQMRDQLRVTAFGTERSVMRRLLDLMCDATVDLTGDLEFTDHCPQFSAMLMLDPSRNIKGTSIVQFVIEDERESVRDRMRVGEEVEGAQAGAVHASLRDSMDSRISTEVFYASYRDLDGAQRFMAGIREVSEQGIAGLKHFKTKHKSKLKKKSRQGSHSSPANHDDSSPAGHCQGSSPAGRGTAPSPPVHTLGSNDAEKEPSDHASRSSRNSGSSSSSVASLPYRPMLPELLPTSEIARQISLVMTTRCWNLEVRSDVCCWYHAAMIELSRIAGVLRTRGCSDLTPNGAAQCQACGMLSAGCAEGSKKCSVCHSGSVESVSRDNLVRL
mmetsp:Transcript_57147/g.145325  ORF Transcript_57147/g.145325 Transcript_57147/m.145325 type:complete len:576 (-) Transcript_57147:39-1766(-)